MAEIRVRHGDFCSDDIALCVMPFFHVGGSAANLFPAFASGATIVIQGTFDETLVLAAIEKEKVTYVGLVPAMIIRLLEDPNLSQYDLSSLGTIMYVGAPMPLDALKRGIGHFGEIFTQLFGQTETLNLAVLGNEEHKVEGSPEEIKRLESAGRRLGKSEIRIADEQGHDVPLEEAGEIRGRSQRMMKGY